MIDVTLPASSWPDHQEEWRLVGRAPNYLISYSGRAYSVPRKFVHGGYLAPFLDDKGYLHISVYQDGKHTKPYVHRLVAEAFLGECPEGMETLHGPNGKLDNRADQLRYDTHQINCDEMVRDGTRRTGEDHWNAVLTQELVAELRLRNAGMESRDTLARKFDLNPGSVASAVRGVVWKDCEVPPVTGSRRGERHQDARLTEQIVMDCRRRRASGTPVHIMAKEYNVRWQTMYYAVNGKTWKHLPLA